MTDIPNIFIRLDMLGRKTTVLNNLKSNSTIGALKEALIDKHGVEGVRLIYCGKPLDKDEATLADYNIHDNSTLFAALRLLGGSQEQVDEANNNNNKKKKPCRQWRSDLLEKYNISLTSDNCMVFCSEYCDDKKVKKAKFKTENGEFLVECADCAYHELHYKKENGKANLQLGGGTRKYDPPDPEIVLSLFEEDEQKEFELSLLENCGIQINIRVCPNKECRVFVYNTDRGFRVRCPSCKAYDWCWICTKKWSSDESTFGCGNEECSPVAFITEELDNCKTKFMDGHTKKIPEFRLCPNPRCWGLNYHHDDCKHYTCRHCRHEYCMACLDKWHTCKCQLCGVDAEDNLGCSLAKDNCPIKKPQKVDLQLLQIALQ